MITPIVGCSSFLDKEYDLRMWALLRGYSVLTTTSSIPGLLHRWLFCSKGFIMSSPSISPSPSSTTDSTTSTSTASDSSGAGSAAPATATLLFGFLVIFAALFAAFLFLAFFWRIQQRRQTAFLPEFDDSRGSNGGVPKLWEAWIRDKNSEKEWKWENTTTVSFCAVQSPRHLSTPTPP